jgi:general secretion pathway protein D
LQGTTLGVGRIGSGSVNFAAVLRAIQSDSHTNIISTPSATTMDNQEAELKSAQEVPFVTGQFSNTGTATNGAVNPFQTIQREEVGTILKVTPTISPEGTAVMMKISIESSSIGQRPAGAVDLVTNKRTASTSVLIEDGGVVVLGGLTTTSNQRQESRVPILGSIPIIGLAFKTRSATTEKDNLMIFIRPKVLRDQAQAAYETDLKYNYMQDQQKSFEHREIPPLLPGEHQPLLPPLPPPPPPGTQAAPISNEEKAKAADASGKAGDTLVQPAPAQPAPTPPPAPAAPAPNGAPPQSSTIRPGLPAPTSTASAVPSTAQNGGPR